MIQMQKFLNMDIWLSRIGLGLIFGYGVAVSILYSYFAQIHVRVRFLPFPIFVGEILLLICLLFFLNISGKAGVFSRRAGLLLGLYFGWVLIKAGINYVYDGPLTCRNAALFSYPSFAVFTYCFWRKAYISRKVLMPLAFFAAVVLFFKIMQVWYWWTYLILLAIAVLKAKSNLWRWLGMIFLTVVLVLGGEYLYHRPRAHFVSVFGAVIFLVFYFGFLLVKWRRYVAVSGLFITFFLFVLGFFILGNRNDVHSVTSLKSVIDTYREFEKRYRAQEVGFVPEKLTSHLYNKKKFSDVFPPDFSVFSEVSHEASPVGSPVLSSQQKSSLSHLMYGYVQNGRSLQLNENNIVFRLFVWRDMYREFIHTPQAWLTGFSFGHPQRSKSLEVLGWAKGEWSRDGWITPHNSFLHIIYRAGILGVGMIGALFFMMAKLIRDFYRMNSIEGGLLMAILIYWMVVSNFFVILEFPYNAIVIWPLFGIAWAYRDQLKEQTTK